MKTKRETDPARKVSISMPGTYYDAAERRMNMLCLTKFSDYIQKLIRDDALLNNIVQMPKQPTSMIAEDPAPMGKSAGDRENAGPAQSSSASYGRKGIKK